MIIREAAPSDIPSLAKLAQKTYADAFGHTMTAVELQDALNARSEGYFLSILGKDTILVALDADYLVGFIQFGEVSYDSIATTKNDVGLNKIFVGTDYQGKGIGKQLIEAMLTHDRLVHVESIYLDVYAENIKAIELYKKYGFQVIGKTPYKANGKTIGQDLLMKRTNKY